MNRKKIIFNPENPKVPNSGNIYLNDNESV